MKTEWALQGWFDKHTGDPCWMVCRNGHLWPAEVPHNYDMDPHFMRGRMRMVSEARMRKVLRCSLCAIMKEAGQKSLRGITHVHPDWLGIVTDARELENGTIEHHHPEQVAKAFSMERVKEWRACLALVSLLQRRYR